MSALLIDFPAHNAAGLPFGEGLGDEAVFELFVRKLPTGQLFLVAAGMEQALDYLETLRLDDAEIEWLVGHGGFPPALRRGHANFASKAMHAMPEGTVFFPDESILRVTAPFPRHSSTRGVTAPDGWPNRRWHIGKPSRTPWGCT